MRLQDLGFQGFGYAPWGAGTPVVTNPGASNTAAGTQPGVSSGSTTNGLDVGGNGSAAAASLNTDPGEIAGFSMRLSYSSTLVQRAPAANTTSAAPVTSDPPAANPASPQQIITRHGRQPQPRQLRQPQPHKMRRPQPCRQRLP
jgi:hypothetical protein